MSVASAVRKLGSLPAYKVALVVFIPTVGVWALSGTQGIQVAGVSVLGLVCIYALARRSHRLTVLLV